MSPEMFSEVYARRGIFHEHRCHQTNQNCGRVSLAGTGMRKPYHAQLLNQLEAVDSATPLLRIDSGNTSLGKIQPIGP